MSINQFLKFKIFKGLTSYNQMTNIQNYMVENQCYHTLLLLEHKPCFTVGRRLGPQNCKNEEERLSKLGADFVYSKRGGEITFHGPGQLVGYPIINLKELDEQYGVRKYVDCIQEILIETCADFQVKAKLTKDTGVWVNDHKKIAAIGIQVQRHIASHGFALNCNTDLSWFDHIIPCGLEGKTTTSLSAETNRLVTVEQVIPRLIDVMATKLKLIAVDLKEVDSDLDAELTKISKLGADFVL